MPKRKKPPVGTPSSAPRTWTGADLASARVRGRIAYLVATRFGGNVRKAANETGLNVRSLQRLADPRSPHAPGIDTVHRVADAFMVDSGWLLTGYESPDALRTDATFQGQLRQLDLAPELVTAMSDLTYPIWRAAVSLCQDTKASESTLMELGYFPWLRSMQLWREFLTMAVNKYGDKRVAKWIADHTHDIRAGFTKGDWPAPNM